MKAIVLAADCGTRSCSLTENKPKALLEVGGKTLLDHLMVKLEGIRTIQDVVIVTNSRYFLDFFYWRRSASYRKNIQIEANGSYFSTKGEGTVRDIMRGMKASPASQDGYLVLCTDNYFDFPLSHFLLPCLGHQDSAFLAAIHVKTKEEASRYGVLELDDHARVISFQEKPASPLSTLVSSGVYFLPSKFQLRLYEYLEIEKLNPGTIGDFISWLTKKETVYGIEFDGAWTDMGDMKSCEFAVKSAELNKKEVKVRG